MPSTPKTKSTADAEGYQVIDDSTLRAITDRRTRELESELAGHRLLLAEQEADPHETENADNPNDPITSTRRTIESLGVRLKVLAERRASLGTVAADNSEG